MDKKNILKGKSIVITRSENQTKDFFEKLTSLGAKVISIPTIEIKPIVNDNIINIYKKIDTYNWIIFTSINSIETFFKSFSNHTFDLKLLDNIRFATVGNKTSLKLLEYGFKPSITPERFTAEFLLKKFTQLNIKNQNILIPGSKLSNDQLLKGLIELKNRADFIAIYEPIKPIRMNNAEDIINADYITFTSPSTVKNFHEIYFDVLKNIKANIVCIGNVTAKSVIELFGITPLIPEEFNIEGMISKIIEHEKSTS